MKTQISRRLFLQMALLAGSSALLAACVPPVAPTSSNTGSDQVAAASSEPKQIAYWHFWTGQHVVFVERIVELFEENNPGSSVDVLSVPGNEYLQKFLAAVASGAPPDVQIISNWQGAVYSFAAQKALLPIDEVAMADDVTTLKEFMSPAIWELGTFENKLFGVATWTQATGIIRNKKLIAEAGLDPEVAPQTLAEFDEMAAALTQYDDRGNITILGGNVPAFWQMWARFGGQLVSDDGRTITANHEGNVRCLEWAVEKAKTFDPRKITSWQEGMQASGTLSNIAGERLSMERTGPWRLGDIKEFNPELEYAVSPDPVVADLNIRASYSYGDVLVIPAGSKYPQEAFTFIGYLCGLNGKELYTDLFITGLRPHIPTSETLAYSDTFEPVRTGYPGYELFLEDLFKADKIATPPKIAVAQFYIEGLRDLEEKAKFGEIAPQEGLDALTATVQAELDKWHSENA